MRDFFYLSPASDIKQFRIYYPYYGLFGSADVTWINNNSEVTEATFKCKLLNGSIVMLKKLLQTKKWIDTSLNKETPLSSVLGNSIDDFLNKLNTIK